MKNKKIIRLFTAALAVALCATAFAVPAFAGGGDGEPYYTETTGTEAAPTGDAESPEVTVTDDEDTAGNNDTQPGADTLDQLAELLGGLGTVTVTEEGIQFTPDAEGLETQQIGTVTTCGGNLNVRTGAGLENDAFTQLPNGAQVEVIGTEGEWVKVLLPERGGLCPFRLPDHHGHGHLLPLPGWGGAFPAPGAVHFRPIVWDRRCPDPGREPLPCG